jgi:hypothetical protein
VYYANEARKKHVTVALYSVAELEWSLAFSLFCFLHLTKETGFLDYNIRVSVFSHNLLSNHRILLKFVTDRLPLEINKLIYLLLNSRSLLLPDKYI